MNKRCKDGLWDETVPGITFDELGVSNYAHMYNNFVKDHPKGEKGKRLWESIVEKIKKDGKGRKYDCLVGVSGGTDSSYLLHTLRKKYELRILAINLDNGWNSNIALKNIKKVTSNLEIDLETYVIDYEEVKTVMKTYMKAGLPWIDGPTDNAIRAIIYRTAYREKIKYILNGEDFTSEGKQPTEWTYTDAKQLLFLIKKFSYPIPKSFPYLTLSKFIFYSYIANIKIHRPFMYLDYDKDKAMTILKDLYDWEYYGGHHHDTLFTKFPIGYWLPTKFNIDKRIITLSARVLNGEITREKALEDLNNNPIKGNELVPLIDFVCKKLDLSKTEFETIKSAPNKLYNDYPSYYPLIRNNIEFISKVLKYFVNYRPKMLYEIESRDGK